MSEEQDKKIAKGLIIEGLNSISNYFNDDLKACVEEVEDDGTFLVATGKELITFKIGSVEIVKREEH